MIEDEWGMWGQNPEEIDEGVGYGRPPKGARFKKGQSGNPKGRPKGTKNKSLPYESILGQEVTIYENGKARVVSAARAAMLKFAEMAMNGKGSMAVHLADVAKAKRKAKEQAEEGPEWDIPTSFTFWFIAPGSVNSALIELRMGRLRDAKRPSATMFLEPWIVQRALERFGDKRLSVEDQLEVLKATRTPSKVKWPEWWQALPEEQSDKQGKER